MDENTYLTERLKDQIDWYDAKSVKNQKYYKRLKVTEICCAALIPFIAASGELIPHTELITGLLGIVIAVSSAVSALNKFHENWIEYRSTAEQLKHEKFLYLTQTKPYDEADRFKVFVLNIESLISRENTSWVQISNKQETATSG